jgi:hypothetical protein
MMLESLRSARAAAAALVFTTMLVASPGTVQALDDTEMAQARALIEDARAEMRSSRDALISENLKLTPAESDAFWPVYREYNRKRAELWDSRLNIFLDYAAKYPDVDDATAKDLINRSLAYDRKLQKLQDAYAPKFMKVLPAAKVMRLLQIDSRIETLVEIQVQQSIPLVEPQG